MNNSSCILPVLEILKNESDSEHILSARMILDILSHRYSISISRQPLYSVINDLIEMGYDISTYEDNHQGYWLIEREFEQSEAIHLLHAIHNCSALTQSQVRKLEDKVLQFIPRHFRSDFTRSAFMDLPHHSLNHEVLLNIELITEAIRCSKMISFSYYHYSPQMKRIPSESPFIHMEPQFIVYKDNHPYLITAGGKHSDTGRYRIDRMADVMIEDCSAENHIKEEDGYALIRNDMFMFSGELIHTVFWCENRIMDAIVDELGTDLHPSHLTDTAFDISVLCSQRNALIFTQKYLDAVTIIEPEWLRKEMEELIVDSLARYQHE